jgi:hypothetical protein
MKVEAAFDERPAAVTTFKTVVVEAAHLHRPHLGMGAQAVDSCPAGCCIAVDILINGLAIL